MPFPYGLVPLSLHVVVLARQSIQIGTMGMECAGRMRGGDVWSEGWKKTRMRHGFEAGGEHYPSLKAVPIKLTPTGMLRTSPDGTLTIGYPGGPARPELANRK